MSRNKYDDAFGVCDITWKVGAPDDGEWGAVLCEVWHAETDLAWSQDRKPRVHVKAHLEVRMFLNAKWMRIDNRGQLVAAGDDEVRRYARLHRNRSWRATIALDGWGA